MITLRRARERHHDQRRNQEVWLTFYPEDLGSPLAGGFGSLEVLNEDRLSAGAAVPRQRQQDSEILTYVRQGALAYEDSTGRLGVIHAGEFRRMTAECGMRHSERNASRIDSAQVFQIRLRPVKARYESGHEQKRFSTAQRRGGLCVVASPDAQGGSLRIQQDARVYSALLRRGQHVVHELAQGRNAWLHMVQGEAALGEFVLNTGDGAGVIAERAVSLTAREETEILLLDLGPEPARARTIESVTVKKSRQPLQIRHVPDTHVKSR